MDDLGFRVFILTIPVVIYIVYFYYFDRFSNVKIKYDRKVNGRVLKCVEVIRDKKTFYKVITEFLVGDKLYRNVDYLDFGINEGVEVVLKYSSLDPRDSVISNIIDIGSNSLICLECKGSLGVTVVVCDTCGFIVDYETVRDNPFGYLSGIRLIQFLINDFTLQHPLLARLIPIGILFLIESICLVVWW